MPMKRFNNIRGNASKELEKQFDKYFLKLVE